MSSAPASGQLRWLPLLASLMPLYAAAVATKNVAYTRGWLTSLRLTAPVISVGNLSVGGAGKTPLVIRLAELLTERGYAVDVLSRGYGRQTGTVDQVRPDADPDMGQDYDGDARSHAGRLFDAERYGDEPLLIARAAGVPVFVGTSRYAAGLLAEQSAARVAQELGHPMQFPLHPAHAPVVAACALSGHAPATSLAPPDRPTVHLLDDGFQHRQLARAIDIVVLHRSDFTARLLPAGRLREPLSSLGRASIAVLREEDASFEPELRRRFPGLPVWRMTREIVLPTALRRAAADPLTPATGALSTPALARSAVAFCGIAHPGEFFHSLTRAGVSLAATHAFRDHHAYSPASIAALARSAQATGAQALLTTEKDLVRLNPQQRATLNRAAPLYPVLLRVRLAEEDAAMTQLLALAGLGAPTGPGPNDCHPGRPQDLRLP